jgi:hypothetical protein
MTATGYTFSKWSVNSKTFSASTSTACNYTNLGVYSGSATLTGTWTANVSGAITLDSKYYASDSATSGINAGTNAAPTPLYSKYATGIYSNSAATTAVTKLTTIPAYTTYVFGGFYTGKAGTGDQVIDAAGNILDAAKTAVATTGGKATWYAKWTQCAACSAGTGANCTLSVVNNVCTYTTSCKAGYGTLVDGGTTSPSCTKCAAGTASADGNNTCSTCAANKWSDAGAGACESCPTGYGNAANASHAGQSSCTITVTAGHYIDTAGQNSSNWKTCAAAKYHAQHTVAYGDVSSACSNISAGYYNTGCGTNASGGVCDSTNYSGGVCESGWSAAGTGTTSTCTACPTNWATSGTAAKYHD